MTARIHRAVAKKGELILSARPEVKILYALAAGLQRALAGFPRTSRKSFQPCLRKPFGNDGARRVAAEFTAATRLIPCHRRTENLGVNIIVQQVHVACSPSIRCQRTPLLPKRTRLTHYASNQGNAAARLTGNTNPGKPAASTIRLAYWPVATFVVA